MYNLALDQNYVPISKRARVYRIPPMYRRVIQYAQSHPDQIVVLSQGYAGGLEYIGLGTHADWLRVHVPGATSRHDRKLGCAWARTAATLPVLLTHAHKLGKTLARLDIFGRVSTYAPPVANPVAQVTSEKTESILFEPAQRMVSMFDTPMLHQKFAPLPQKLNLIDRVQIKDTLYTTLKPSRAMMRDYAQVVRCLPEHFSTLQIIPTQKRQQVVVSVGLPLLPAPKIAGLLVAGPEKSQRVIVPGLTQYGQLHESRVMDGDVWHRITFSIGSTRMTAWRKTDGFRKVG